MNEERKETPAPVNPPPAPDTEAPSEATAERTPEEIQRDIEATRHELGETVAAVAEKADVKKQAHAKVDDVKERAQETFSEAPRVAKDNPVPVALAAAFVAGVIVGRILTRR